MKRTVLALMFLSTVLFGTLFPVGQVLAGSITNIFEIENNTDNTPKLIPNLNYSPATVEKLTSAFNLKQDSAYTTTTTTAKFELNFSLKPESIPATDHGDSSHPPPHESPAYAVVRAGGG